MKIVVTDGYTLNPGDNPWDRVAALGEMTIHDLLDPADVPAKAQGAEVIIVNKTLLPKETLEALPDLKLITVAATGYDCVDIEAAGALGVPVCNIPIYGTDTVAQYAMAALLEMCHHVGLHDKAVKQGEWAGQPHWSYWKTPLIELRDKTMGIVGFGRIGRRVGELAHAFGMKVLAHDPFPGSDPDYAPFAWAELDEVFATCDVVSLHSPQTKDNAGFVNAALLAKMKPTAMLINCARGGLVNEQDLAEALNKGTLAAATCDVVSSEPIKGTNPLLKAKNIILTGHMAWATKEARERLMGFTADNIQAYLDGKPINVVNSAYLK